MVSAQPAMPKYFIPTVMARNPSKEHVNQMINENEVQVLWGKEMKKMVCQQCQKPIHTRQKRVKINGRETYCCQCGLNKIDELIILHKEAIAEIRARKRTIYPKDIFTEAI
jgi:hypothetical protein